MLANTCLKNRTGPTGSALSEQQCTSCPSEAHRHKAAPMHIRVWSPVQPLPIMHAVHASAHQQPSGDAADALNLPHSQSRRCPCRSLVSPVVAGVELLPPADTLRPLMFVGNHSRMGVYDLPWLLSELYMRGIKVPALPGPWDTPLLLPSVSRA